MDKRKKLGLVAVVTSTACLSSSISFAQQTAAAGPIQEVVVTGSRIKRADTFDSPVPIAIISGDALKSSGFTVLGDAMSNLPQSMVSTNLQSSSGTLFNAGQSRVDLRGLGSARTLVLVDGRRHLTGDFRTSSVDLNMIPSTMIDRIDAISGGASAVYGSEAIAGVVNIVLKRRMEGIEIDAQGGMTEDGDGEEWKTSIGYGTSFANDRGSFLIGGEFGKVEPIFQRDRDWAYPGIRRNTLVNPQTVVPQSRSNVTPTATFQLVASADPNVARSSSIAVDRSGVFANSPECRTSTVRPLCQDPWLYYTGVLNALQGEFERQSARAYVDFALTDNMTTFADVSYTRVDGTALFQPAFSNAVGGGTLPAIIRGDNAYLNGSTPLAGQLRDQWVAAGRPLTRATTVNIGKFWSEFGPRDTRAYRDSYRAVAGLEGNFELFGRDFEWDSYAQYSELEGFTNAYNVPNIQRLLASLDATVVGGQIVCTDPTQRAAGCVPWDIINGPSQDAVNWSNAIARTDGSASQMVIAANLTTSLFDLPAGPLGFAIGAEYREEDSDQVQDPLSASGALFYNGIGRTKGEYDIKEAYTEIVVPILNDLPAVHRFDVELAGRIGDYSTVGEVEQWRVGATWAPLQDLSFRASQASSVRAPNITELFGPQGRNFTTAANDPCDLSQVAGIAGDAARRATRVANCAAAIPGYNPATFVSNIGTGRSSLALLQGGNPDLTEETADTFTVGMVFRPSFLDGFNFSFDYWKVEVEDAVSTIPINTLLTNLCYDSGEAYSSNRFCGLVLRDTTGATTGGLVGGVREVVLTNQNVQSIETSGWDAAVQYDFALGSIGSLQTRVDVTKVIRWDLAGVPGGPVTHYAGTLPGPNGAVPEYKANATIGWAWDRLTLQWQSRVQDSYAVSEVDPSSSRDPFYTGNYWEHDIRAAFRVTDALSLRLGIINVTNEEPPPLPEAGTGTGTASATFDNRGRWFYVGGSYSFSPGK